MPTRIDDNCLIDSMTRDSTDISVGADLFRLRHQGSSPSDPCSGVSLIYSDSSDLHFILPSGDTENLTSGYFKLAGRAGGQVATGGTGSGDDLEFKTTSHATKGDYLFSDNAVIKRGHTDSTFASSDTFDTRNNGTNAISIHAYGDSPGEASYTRVIRARGTQSSVSDVQNGDRIGGILAHARSNSSFQGARGQIRFEVDGTVSGSSIPTSIKFFTGSTSASEQLSIGSDGDSTFKNNLVDAGSFRSVSDSGGLANSNTFTGVSDDANTSGTITFDDVPTAVTAGDHKWFKVYLNAIRCWVPAVEDRS